MNVFISSSGELSSRVAKILRYALPTILQSMHVFYSSEDVKIGSFWLEQISDNLRNADFMILCLTKANIRSPWILFEAGAASGRGNVLILLLIDVSHSDFDASPLAQFQSTRFVREDLYKLIVFLNDKLESPLSLSILERSFHAMWPSIEMEYTRAINDSTILPIDKKVNPRSHKED